MALIIAWKITSLTAITKRMLNTRPSRQMFGFPENHCRRPITEFSLRWTRWVEAVVRRSIVRTLPGTSKNPSSIGAPVVKRSHVAGLAHRQFPACSIPLSFWLRPSLSNLRFSTSGIRVNWSPTWLKLHATSWPTRTAVELHLSKRFAMSLAR